MIVVYLFTLRLIACEVAQVKRRTLEGLVGGRIDSINESFSNLL